MRPSAAIRATGLPVHEARLLLAHVLGCEPGALALVPAISDADAAALASLVSRRAAGEPLQHLTGRAYFRSVAVEVGPGVFIPRPETEVLVGWALGVLQARPKGGTPPVVVELCAGSGAISAALAHEFPAAVYHAVERSDEAWPYLQRNLRETGVRTLHADMADALHDRDGAVDLVIVNPPYVPDAARPVLPSDVLHDPDEALFSGPDGLDALRVVVEVAARLLRDGGWVGSEHDDTHGLSAPGLFLAHGGFARVSDHVDLAGRDRFVTAQRDEALDAGRMGA